MDSHDFQCGLDVVDYFVLSAEKPYDSQRNEKTEIHFNFKPLNYGNK